MTLTLGQVWAIVSVTPSVANTKGAGSSIANADAPSPVHRRPPSLAGENANKARESGKEWSQMRSRAAAQDMRRRIHVRHEEEDTCMRSRAAAQDSQRAARTVYSVVRPRDSVSLAASGATFAEEMMSCMGRGGVGWRHGACTLGAKARAPSYFVLS